MQQQSIHHAEDCGVCADAERESKDDDGGEAGRLTEHAKRIANVLKQRFEKRKATGLAMFFFGLLRPTEADHSSAASLGGGKPALKILFDCELEMSRHFGVEVAVNLLATEERANAVEQLAKAACHLCLLLSLPDLMSTSFRTVIRNATQQSDRHASRARLARNRRSTKRWSEPRMRTQRPAGRADLPCKGDSQVSGLCPTPPLRRQKCRRASARGRAISPAGTVRACVRQEPCAAPIRACSAIRCKT